jgi:hypothetical protein
MPPLRQAVRGSEPHVECYDSSRRAAAQPNDQPPPSPDRDGIDRRLVTPLILAVWYLEPEMVKAT